jgi:putative peptidoglycan lipid II flippase
MRDTVPDRSAAPPRDSDRNWLAGLRIVGLLTLASRVLGLARDVLMAAVFGNGAVMDAFSVAFRIPNLARRLFGEGALSTAFLPAFVRESEQRGEQSAWKLAGTLFVALAGVLAAVVLLAELLLAAALWWNGSGESQLLLFLTAVMLPYLLLICLAAQFSAVLHARNHFTWPALLPVVLNVVWIATLVLLVPRFETPGEQITVVAVCVLVGGALQLVTPLPMLLQHGFRFQTDWAAHRRTVAGLARALLPILLGLSIMQINTLADSLIAWCFSRPEDGPAEMPLFGGVDYPMVSGTASALYFAQRMYQFPLGVFGVALGTVLFPLFTRQAHAGEFGRLRESLSLGLRLVTAIGLPAGIGLIVLAGPLTALLFQHGAFDAEDAAQTAGMIAVYGGGVWAYCGLLIVNRAFYAMNDAQTPLRLGVLAVLVNLSLDFVLIWPLGGNGLALGTAVAATLQFLLAVGCVQARLGRFDWRPLLRSFAKTLVACLAMFAACRAALQFCEADGGFTSRLFRVALPFAAAVAVYFATARLLGLREPELLFRRNVGAERDHRGSGGRG